MIRVLQVISDRNIGGAGIQLCNLLRHLNPERFRCTVALPRESELTERLVAMGVETVELAHPCDRLLAESVREIKGIIRSLGIDIVHANAAVSARMAGKLCGCRVIHTRHCYFPVETPRGGARQLLLRMGNRWLSDLAIATAPSAAENLMALGFPQRLVRVILNGSDPVREIRAEELAALRRHYGIGEGDSCIGICARLEACKGHRTFLDAAARLKKVLPHEPLRFLVVGEGSLRQSLEAYANGLGLGDAVIFTGFVRDMAPIYRLLRINVNCSCGTETSCLALSEGMSAALPTVATDYGGNRVMIEGGGLSYPVGDAEALSERLREILTNSALEAELQHRSLESYRCRFTAERMTRETEALYSMLTANRC